MDETEGDSRYLPNYGVNQGYESSKRPKVTDNYVDLEEEEDEEHEDDEEQEHAHDSGDTDDEDDNFNQHRHPKKRKLKSLLSSFELVPRVAAGAAGPQPLAALPPLRAARPSFGGRNTLTDWSEQETFALLEAWGERFLQRGRKSLRSEEWQEVAQKVSQLKFERTDTQCRNRLDTLKKKYKKEKASFETGKQTSSKWVYFHQMDTLMSSTPPSRQFGSGGAGGAGPTARNVPVAYFDNTDDDMNDDSDSVPVPTKPSKKREKETRKGVNGSFKLIADSINKFSEIYEKIETRKRKQMVELEKMRMDFHKELELQKKQIFDKAKDEIAKMRQGDYEENDSADNISG